MDLLERYGERLHAFLNATSTIAQHRAALAVMVGAACLVILQSLIGPTVMTGKPGDVPQFLDAAWRIHHGQIPHTDFFSHLGSLPYHLVHLGMKLTGPGVFSIVAGNLILMVSLTAAALFLLPRRTSAPLTILFALFTALLVIAPRPLGDPYFFNDYAMLYNRQGEAILLLLTIGLLIRPHTTPPRLVAMAEQVLFGLMITALLLIKLNYFVIALLILALATGTQAIHIRNVAPTVISAAVLLLLYSALTGVKLPDFWADMQTMSAAQDFTGKVTILAIQTAKHALWLPLVAVLIWETIHATEAKNTPSRRQAVCNLLTLVALAGAALLLLSSNAQRTDLPLLAAAALYSFEKIRRHRPKHLVAATAFVCLFVAPTLLGDAYAIRHSTFNAIRHRTSDPVLATTQLADLHLQANGETREKVDAYRQWLHDGLDLIRRHPEAAQGLRPISFSDPFVFALRLTPPRGGAICVAYNTVNAKSHPPLSRMIGDASHVLLDPNGPSLNEIFGRETAAYEFRLVEETPLNALYRVLPAKTN